VSCSPLQGSYATTLLSPPATVFHQHYINT